MASQPVDAFDFTYKPTLLIVVFNSPFRRPRKFSSDGFEILLSSSAH